MVFPTEIAQIMGGEKVFSHPIHSLGDLEIEIEKGLPKEVLKNISAFVSENNTFIYKVVPEGTYKRRKAVLSLEESEKAERIARVIATSLHIWGNREKAQRFLKTPHSFFKDRRPIDVSLTELGARQVEDLLWQIYYGHPA